MVIKLFKTLFISFFVFYTFCSFSAGLEETDVDGVVEGTMTRIVHRDFGGVFDFLSGIWEVGEERKNKFLDHHHNINDRLRKRIGESYAFEVIDRKKVGRNLLKYEVLEVAEYGGVYWFFVFYKQEDGWRMKSLRWDGDYRVIYK